MSTAVTEPEVVSMLDNFKPLFDEDAWIVVLKLSILKCFNAIVFVYIVYMQLSLSLFQSMKKRRTGLKVASSARRTSTELLLPKDVMFV